ncbi:S1C family serine protease [Homoserinibacter sp. YIM 151385]|uniref:S1C family serine protease n=1 Tax=Homoserinibacter sp. YIM 151385 TaxID=2985506 RepID=UPI0022EFED1C|nr:trypsin-like peptidase domain-containing protein [Homoserinibacter sp. YIM 151385]WBU38162.1 trypsin-like peptidase domain-containing protein [Homoserinibacter sp. YIM 151385]
MSTAPENPDRRDEEHDPVDEPSTGADAVAAPAAHEPPAPVGPTAPAEDATPADVPAGTLHEAPAVPAPAATPAAPVAASAPAAPAAPFTPPQHPTRPTAPLPAGSAFRAPEAPHPGAGQQAPGQQAPGQYAPGQQPGAPTTAKRSIAIPVIAALAVGALIGGASGAGIAAAVVSANSSTGTAAEASPQSITVNDPENANQVTAVAAKAAPSVVTIAASGSGSAGTGSGVILSDDGYVLTNTHVVTLDGATGDAAVEVTTYDGRIYEAEIVGTDPTTDLAVIKLVDASGLTPIEWGDSTRLNVGDSAIAIGAPLGLANTVTDGIVSALNRSIQIASSAAPDSSETEEGEAPNDNGQGGDSPFDFWNFDDNGQQGGQQPTSTISIPVVQTDAAINPGNSGGALVDDEGKLIGINVAIASTGSSQSGSQSGSIGVGFAVPSSVAKRISEELIADGSATHGLLGASVRDATVDDGGSVGAVIAEAPIAGGAADTAGLRSGDIVTAIDGIPITGATDLTAQVRALAAGAEATITYVRGERSAEVDVTLGELEG